MGFPCRVRYASFAEQIIEQNWFIFVSWTLYYLIWVNMAMLEKVDEIKQRCSTSWQVAGELRHPLCFHQHHFLLWKIQALGVLQAENKCAFQEEGVMPSQGNFQMAKSKGSQDMILYLSFTRERRGQSSAPVTLSCTLGTNKNSSVTCGFDLRSESNRSVSAASAAHSLWAGKRMGRKRRGT